MRLVLWYLQRNSICFLGARYLTSEGSKAVSWHSI
jgi:hypothetical protein